MFGQRDTTGIFKERVEICCCETLQPYADETIAETTVKSRP